MVSSIFELTCPLLVRAIAVDSFIGFIKLKTSSFCKMHFSIYSTYFINVGVMLCASTPDNISEQLVRSQNVVKLLTRCVVFIKVVDGRCMCFEHSCFLLFQQLFYNLCFFGTLQMR